VWSPFLGKLDWLPAPGEEPEGLQADWPLKNAQTGGLAARLGSESWGVIMSGVLPYNITMQQFRCGLQRAERPGWPKRSARGYFGPTTK
jgi:hypothetical protein